ncbi:Quinate permease [Lachnellula willkommii]|uniref:Quinate permease n=1 Tax=Lachnellula willkommii TaxID=215461 RepID=A0A559M3M3_9HELO|nr:Quinate permease [Lachnellula willkommii]
MGLLQKVVKNEAMKQDPPQIYGWKVFFLSASACFGGMLFGWDIGSIGGILVMPSFMKAYGIANLSAKDKANLQSNIVSTLQGGCFFGSLIAYYIADRWGRKPALLIASMVTMIGIIIQCSSDGHVAALYVGRLVAGLGVGAASMLTPLYVRTMLSFWTNYGTLGNLKGNAQWQVPLALQALPALALFFGLVLCNESPRWLARQDNWDKATIVLTRLRNLPVDHEYIHMELEERLLIGGASFIDLQKEMWLIKGNRNRALTSIGLMICQQMTGTNAINYYAPLIFLNLGIPPNKDYSPQASTASSK